MLAILRSSRNVTTFAGQRGLLRDSRTGDRYLAYTAYRQNRSRPMLYIAIGFILVLFVQAPLALIFIHILELPTPQLTSLLQFPEFDAPRIFESMYGLQRD